MDYNEYNYDMIHCFRSTNRTVPSVMWITTLPKLTVVFDHYQPGLNTREMYLVKLTYNGELKRGGNESQGGRFERFESQWR